LAAAASAVAGCSECLIFAVEYAEQAICWRRRQPLQATQQLMIVKHTQSRAANLLDANAVRQQNSPLSAIQ
jgi:hypothetical protein